MISPVNQIERLTLMYMYDGKQAGEIEVVVCEKCGIMRKLPDV